MTDRHALLRALRDEMLSLIGPTFQIPSYAERLAWVPPLLTDHHEPPSLQFEFHAAACGYLCEAAAPGEMRDPLRYVRRESPVQEGEMPGVELPLCWPKVTAAYYIYALDSVLTGRLWHPQRQTFYVANSEWDSIMRDAVARARLRASAT